MHLVAIARAAGITLSWNDIADLSAVVPLLARVYPNGKADVNHFHAAGGMAFVINSLLDAGLMHEDVRTVAGDGLRRYTTEPKLDSERLRWVDGARESLDTTVVRSVADPFAPDGGLKTLTGNLGTSVIKTSAVNPEHRVVTAPARGVRQPRGVPGRIPIRFAGPRSRRGGALPGSAGPRHARTAQAHPGFGRVAGPRSPGGACHRWPHVRRVRKGPGRNPSHSRGGGRWTDRPAARRRHHHRRCRRRNPVRRHRRRRVRRPYTDRAAPQPTNGSAPAANCSPVCARPSAPPTRAQPFSGVPS